MPEILAVICRNDHWLGEVLPYLHLKLISRTTSDKTMCAKAYSPIETSDSRNSEFLLRKLERLFEAGCQILFVLAADVKLRQVERAL